jgi:hypothetical protein
MLQFLVSLQALRQSIRKTPGKILKVDRIFNAE